VPDLLQHSPREAVARGSHKLLAAGLLWLAWIVVHYYAIPSGPFSWREPGELFPASYAREAAIRAAAGLLGAAAVWLAAWAGGRLLIGRPTQLFESRLERLIFQLALGCGAFSFACLLLAFAGWYRPAVVRTMTTGLAAVAIVLSVRARKRLTEPLGIPVMRPRDRLLAACALVACAFAFVGALAPETEYDALWYHLWLPDLWLAAGHPVDIVREYVSLYPLTWELLFGAAMTVGGPVAAKLLHYGALILVGITTGLFSARWFPQGNGVAAAGLAVAVPLMIWEGTTAYVDLTLAWYVTASAYALVRHDETRDVRWLLVGALTMGIALAIKNLALIAFAVTGLCLLARELGQKPVASALRRCALFGAVALLIPSVWYMRAWTASGNPVFPEAYAVFGARPPGRWDSEADRMLGVFKDHFGRERSVRHILTLPWDVTMHGARYGGTLGPAFLLLVPVALAAAVRRGPTRQRTLALLAAIIGYLLLWSSPISSLQLRFLVPLVPFLAVLAGEGLRRLPLAGWIVTALLLIANLPPFTSWHEADRRGWTGWLTHTARLLPLPVVVGSESQEQYLARTVPSYRAWRYIDAHASAAWRVLTFSGGDHLYSHTERVWSDATAARAATWAAPAGDEASARAALRELGITHILFDKRQLAEGPAGALAVASAAMRACCLERVYEDERFAVYRLR
jgi:hypothetical protein